MTIAIIGIGRLGGALARLWSERGHKVWAGVRDTASGSARKLKQEANVEIASVAEAVAQAELIVLCVPWPAMQDSLREAGACRGKILIDATNPLSEDMQFLEVGTTTSAAEMIAALVPQARVVKGLNTIGSTALGIPSQVAPRFDGYFCGDDADAKATARQLIEDAGLEPIDVGPLKNARLLEPLALLWIDLKFVRGFKGEFGFKLLGLQK